MPPKKRAAAVKETRRNVQKTLSGLIDSDEDDDASVVELARTENWQSRNGRRAMDRAIDHAMDSAASESEQEEEDDDEIIPVVPPSVSRKPKPSAVKKKQPMVRDETPMTKPRKGANHAKTVSAKKSTPAVPARLKKQASLDMIAEREDREDSLSQSEGTPAAARVGYVGEDNNDLRRKLTDLRRQHDSLLEKYSKMKCKRTTQAEELLASYKTRAEERYKASDEVIASLTKELEDASKLAHEAKQVKREPDRSREIESLQSQLMAALNEGDMLSAKLHARSTGPFNKYKEDIYADLSGLLVRDMKLEDDSVTYDCIHSGKNGSESYPQTY